MGLGISAYNAALVPTATSAVVDAAQQNAAASTANNAANNADDSSNASASNSDKVSISAQAQQLLSANATTPSKPTTPPRGALFFDAKGATVGGKRVALIDIINSKDGTYTDTERQAATRQINQREAAGFRWAKPTGQAAQDPVAMKQYYATYLSYLQKLSPEEQKSSRYAGEIDHAKQLIKQEDVAIARSNIQQISAGGSNGSAGLFGPIMTGISLRLTQQLAGLPNTKLTTTAKFYQLTISQPRTADQVLATPDPTTGKTGPTTGGTSSGGTSSGAGSSGGNGSSNGSGSSTGSSGTSSSGTGTSGTGSTAHA